MLKNIKKLDHNLIALAGVSAGLLAMALSRDVTSIALVAGVIMLMTSLLLSEKMLQVLFSFFIERMPQSRKTLARIQKTLNDFNRANESRYSSFSDSAVNLKRSIKSRKSQRRAEFGEIASLFGWKKEASPALPIKAQATEIKNTLNKTSTLFRNFLIGANRILVLRMPNGSFQTVTIFQRALAKAIVLPIIQNRIADFQQAVMPELEIPESLQQSWGKNAEPATEQDNAEQDKASHFKPILNGGGI